MEEKKEKVGCSSIIGILVCFGIAAAIFSPLVPYIGFLAYPLIGISGILIGKATEPLWYRGKKK